MDNENTGTGNTTPTPAPTPMNVGFSITCTVLGKKDVVLSVSSVEKFDQGLESAGIAQPVSANLSDVITQIQKAKPDWTLPSWLTGRLDGIAITFTGWYRKAVASTATQYQPETSSSFSFQIAIVDSNLLSTVFGSGTADKIVSDLIAITSVNLDATRGTKLPVAVTTTS